ncbi:polysaccharide deacetylase [Ornithinibacillus sp. 4-3]|uniref:Polysaccharide deacetylase n=1 Tax=Ornithinibacillus sp. 4-3 TaxID=3231488 RepID=A0AB39HLU8_9BACI
MAETYQWPGHKKVAVALSIDFDGESPFLWKNRNTNWSSIGEYEHRKFGPRQGVHRIIDLLAEHNIKASFYIPGYTARKYPQIIKKIHNNGHEIGLHGDMHELVDELNRDELERTIVEPKKVIEDLIGEQVVGYRSPSWELTADTIELLQKHDIQYDSSLMGYDHPYSIEGLPEIPVQWLLDDVVFYRYVGGGKVHNSPKNPQEVIEIWKEEFLGLKRYNGLFLLTMHPWVTGRASRIIGLENLIQYFKNDKDIWFATCKEIAEYHQENYQGKFDEKVDIIHR